MKLLLLLVSLAVAYVTAAPTAPSVDSSLTTTKKFQAGLKEKFEAIRCLHGDKKTARVALLSEESKYILAQMEAVHAQKPDREERKRLMDAVLATASDAVKKEMAFDHSQTPTKTNPRKD